jgi:hypothetical protein
VSPRWPTPPSELNSAALLDDVRCFVSGGVQVGHRRERHLIAGRVRGGADLARCIRRRATYVCANAAYVVAAEQRLDRCPVRKCTGRPGDAARGRSLDLGALEVAARLYGAECLALTRCGFQLYLFDDVSLAGRTCAFTAGYTLIKVPAPGLLANPPLRPILHSFSLVLFVPRRDCPLKRVVQLCVLECHGRAGRDSVYLAIYVAILLHIRSEDFCR